jgi:hypothetical protein
MGANMTVAVELTRLRARVDALAHRRVAALERLAPLQHSPSRRRLEAMQFELAELEWQLADLEATP